MVAYQILDTFCLRTYRVFSRFGYENHRSVFVRRDIHRHSEGLCATFKIFGYGISSKYGTFKELYFCKTSVLSENGYNVQRLRVWAISGDTTFLQDIKLVRKFPSSKTRTYEIFYELIILIEIFWQLPICQPDLIGQPE